MIITIDGPTASGKSTIAYQLAQKLGFYYLPTGWIYRAVAYILVEHCGYTQETLSNPSEQDVAYCLDPEHLVYQYDMQKGGVLYFKNQDITPFLKDYKIDRSVAVISPIVMVREMVVHTQRTFAQQHDSVIEGRDIGSVVFPHADYKFYLTASLTVRAQRWMHDQKKRGHIFTQSQAEEEVASRDQKDLERSHSPLKVPEGAIIIDNSAFNLQETIEMIINCIDSSLNEKIVS
jgi:cytidylate kinase